MKKFILLALLMVGIVSIARAENSATAYDGKYYSQQVFVTAYNVGNALNNNSVAILAVPLTDGTTNGGQVQGTVTSDSIFIFGVTDEAIPSGQLGRICVRGPHKVVMNSSVGQTSGQIIGASSTFGAAGWYSTSDGTAGGQLGYLISTTASTATGDASNTYWSWITPRIHK